MDISKVEIAGPCRITWGGIDLGHTLDGIDVTIEREFEDVVVDKYGSMPIDKVLTGTRAMIAFKLAQPKFKAFDVAMPESSSIDGSAADRADIGADAGYSLRQDAKQLVIHPLKNADGDQTDDVVFYLAVSVENMEVPYKIDEQKVVPITMQALVSEQFGSGRRLGHIGPAAVS